MLGRGGWRDLGDFRVDRAAALATGLRHEGEVVRVEGERLPRPRIGWSDEESTGTLLGRIDDITLFVVVPPPLRQRSGVGTSAAWVMHVLLPGYQSGVYEFRNQIETMDAAERLLDMFQWRIGVRGWRHPQEGLMLGDTETQVMPKVSTE